MTAPRENPKRPPAPPADDDEFKIVSEPVQQRVLPENVKRQLHAAQQKRISTADEPPPAPRWPMFSGILTFPFYLNSLGPLVFISLGLMVGAWLLMFWIEYGPIMGAASAWYLGLPTCLVGILTLGYAASCSLIIIEQTYNGMDTIELSAPGIDWKEWIWNFAHIAVLALQAAIVGYVAQRVISSNSSLPMAVGTFAAFPLVLLGALVADGAWVPLAIVKVLLSLVQVWWAWGIFYLATGAMAAGWTILTKSGLVGPNPWLTPLYAAPLLAIIILIYARLIGRLAVCIAAATTRHLTQGEDHE